MAFSVPASGGVDAASQVSLVMSTVSGLNDLAENAYTAAQNSMEALTNIEINFTPVVVGAEFTPVWGSISPVATPVEPDYIDAIDAPDFATFVAPTLEAPTFDPDFPNPPAEIIQGSQVAPTLSLTDPVIPEVSGNLEVQPTLSITPPTIPSVTNNTGNAPTLSIVNPTIPSITPAAIDAPVWDIDLSDTPSELDPIVLGDLPTLSTLPTIDTIIPTMDVSLLTVDPADDFVEPTYVERVSPQVQANIQLALNGGMGLPADYWDSLWAQVAADISQQSAAEARRARNSGAASFWALPGEVVTITARRAAEEASKKLTWARLEQAKQQAVFEREDFWQAVSKGIEYENQWINAHDRLAQRALAASEQLYNIRVQVHNANISRYNAILDAAKLDSSISEMNVQHVLSQIEAELKISAQQISQAGLQLEEYKTRWQGYQISKTVVVAAMAEEIKLWNGRVDADVKYQSLGVETAKLEVDLVRTQVQAFAEELKAWLGAVDADVKYQGLAFEGAKAEVQVIQAKAQVFAEEMRGWLGKVDAETKYKSLSLDATKLTLLSMDTKVKAFSEEMRGWTAQVEADVKYKGLNLESAKLAYTLLDSQTKVFSEQVRAWSTQVDAETKYASLSQGADKLNLDKMVAQIQQVTGLASATAQMLGARVGASELELKTQALQVDKDKAANSIGIEVAKVAQAAQETTAKLEIAQSQWTIGQTNALAQNVAQLSYGFAQAAVSASDVGLSSSVGLAFNDSESASHNAERVW